MKLVDRSSAHAVQVSFFVDPGGRNGEALLREWHTLSGVAAGAARAGASVTIVQGAARRETVERAGVTYQFVDDTRRFRPRLPRGIGLVTPPPRIVELVRSLRPDVIHVRGFVDLLAVRALTRALPGVPVMVQDHSSRLPREPRRSMWRFACRSIDAVAFTARDQSMPFVEAGVFRRGTQVFEILGGSSSFTPGDREEARSKSGIHGDPCFLWAGRLDANKDPLTALDAFEQAARSLPEARLWFVFREAPLLDAVTQRIARSSVLGPRVTLIGAREHADMEQLFRAADFFVQTSHFEATGFSAIEAVACGTPALLTDIPSFRRIVNGGDAGSITPVGDAQALAGEMIRFASEDREGARERARQWFDRGLSFDTIGRELRDAYETLARRGAAAR